MRPEVDQRACITGLTDLKAAKLMGVQEFRHWTSLLFVRVARNALAERACSPKQKQLPLPITVFAQPCT